MSKLLCVWKMLVMLFTDPHMFVYWCHWWNWTFNWYLLCLYCLLLLNKVVKVECIFVFFSLSAIFNSYVSFSSLFPMKTMMQYFMQMHAYLRIFCSAWKLKINIIVICDCFILNLSKISLICVNISSYNAILIFNYILYHYCHRLLHCIVVHSTNSLCLNF